MMKDKWQTWASLGGLAGLAVGLTAGYLIGLKYSAATLREFRDDLEVIYFVAAGPLVFVVLLAGLSQVVVSVREISKRSRREAATLAISTCEKFAHDFFPVEREAVRELMPHEWKLLDDSFRWDSFAEEEKARIWVAGLQLDPARETAATNVVNSIEALAMAFIHGEADNAIGFHTIGAPFCQSVRRWAPHLVALRTQQSTAASGKFAATIRLYRLWEALRRATA